MFGNLFYNLSLKFSSILDKADGFKYTKKSVFNSLIKYQIMLFVLVLCTYKIFAVYMIPAWLMFVFLSWHYARIWRYQGYSILFLIFVSLTVIFITILISPVIRMGLGKLFLIKK